MGMESFNRLPPEEDLPKKVTNLDADKSHGRSEVELQEKAAQDRFMGIATKLALLPNR